MVKKILGLGVGEMGMNRGERVYKVISEGFNRAFLRSTNHWS
jgi:hypothetical protein